LHIFFSIRANPPDIMVDEWALKKLLFKLFSPHWSYFGIYKSNLGDIYSMEQLITDEALKF
jgi:hypothetical protein